MRFKHALTSLYALDPSVSSVSMSPVHMHVLTCTCSEASNASRYAYVCVCVCMHAGKAPLTTLPRSDWRAKSLVGSAAIEGPDGCLAHLARSYAPLHRDMVTRKRRARWLISSCVSGLSDCLTGAITSFYLALLMQRAFVMYYTDHHLQYEWVYDQPHINWTLPFPKIVSKSSVPVLGIPPIEPGPENNRIVWALVTGNITNVYKYRTYVRMETNAGIVVRFMVENPHYKEVFGSLGITAETAYQCAYAFLFRPNREVQDMLRAEARMLLDPKVISIGVQVRMGDDVLGKHVQPTDFDIIRWFQTYLECVYALKGLLDSVAPERQVGDPWVVHPACSHRPCTAVCPASASGCYCYHNADVCAHLRAGGVVACDGLHEAP